MKSIISLGLAVAMLVACGGGAAQAQPPKANPVETPTSFTGKWNVSTVLYRDSSPSKSLENRRERLFHKSITVEKDSATLLDHTCTTSTVSAKIGDAEAEAKRRHVSTNELGIIRKTDRLLIGTLTCKTSSGSEVEEHMYRRVRDGKLDGTLIIITADFMLGLDQK